jgi:hypothetical protein
MKIYPTFVVSILEPFHESTILGRHIQPPPLLEMDGEEKFEVEFFLDSQVFGEHLECLVYWHDIMLANICENLFFKF